MMATPISAETVPDALLKRVTVIVPVLNEADYIETTLRSLLPGCAGAEVLIVDGGSDDGTVGIVERVAATFDGLAILANPRRSQAAGVNLGVSLARPDRDIIVRCDAHGRYPPNFVRDLAGKLIEKDADSVVVPMDAAAREGAGPFERAVALVVDTPLGAGGSPHRGGRRSGWVDHGHHAAMRRENFARAGGYDEDFIANEDAEFDTRLRRGGGRIWLEAGIRMVYFVRPGPGALWSQYRRYGQGRAHHVFRRGGDIKLRQIVPALHVAALAVSAGLAMATFALPALWPLALLYPAIYLAAILTATGERLVRRKSADALLVPAVLAILHIAWGIGFWTGAFGSPTSAR